jgi:hypothetical protein
VIITNSTIAGNHSGWYGGGIVSSAGLVTITNSTIARNTAPFGGGDITNSEPGTMTITNSIIVGNRTGEEGGGIFIVRTMTIINSTLADNEAEGVFGGGGIHVSGDTVVELRNTMLTRNPAAGSAPDWSVCAEDPRLATD